MFDGFLKKSVDELAEGTSTLADNAGSSTDAVDHQLDKGAHNMPKSSSRERPSSPKNNQEQIHTLNPKHLNSLHLL